MVFATPCKDQLTRVTGRGCALKLLSHVRGSGSICANVGLPPRKVAHINHAVDQGARTGAFSNRLRACRGVLTRAARSGAGPYPPPSILVIVPEKYDSQLPENLTGRGTL